MYSSLSNEVLTPVLLSKIVSFVFLFVVTSYKTVSEINHIFDKVHNNIATQENLS